MRRVSKGRLVAVALSVMVTAASGGLPVSSAEPELQQDDASSTSRAVVGEFRADGNLDIAIAQGVAAGDFRGNGILDLAVVGESVRVRLGNGDGTFQDPVTYPAATRAAVAVLLGNGDGTFQPALSLPLPGVPSAVVTGDFDGDGNLDLALLTFRSVSILLGNGDGTFRPGIPNQLPMIEANLIAAGDFNRDGKTDLAIVSNFLWVLLSKGDGTFEAPVRYELSRPGPVSGTTALIIADFRANGILDVAVDTIGGFVFVLLGNGDGTFQPSRRYGDGDDSDDLSTALVAGDFRGAGILDLALFGIVARQITILLGNGDGSFQGAARFGVGPGRELPFIAAGDFDNDGSLDLAVAGPEGVTIRFGAGDGTFQHAPGSPFTEFGTRGFFVQPQRIVTGPGGLMWFTQNGASIYGRLQRIRPDGRVPTENGFGPSADICFRCGLLRPGITVGPDGNLWYPGVLGGPAIARTTPDGLTAQFPLGGSTRVIDIAAGPDGNLWFTETDPDGDQIGQITPDGEITEFAIPTATAAPAGIAAGADGNLWFTESGAGQIGRITLDGAITEFPISTPNSQPIGIVAGPDGNFWFTEAGAGRIGRITPDGVITEFPIPTPDSQPAGIAVGPDGNLWFTEVRANKIGQLHVSPKPYNKVSAATITEFEIPTRSAPIGIAAGPDGNIWFTESGGPIGRGSIGRLILEDQVPPCAKRPDAKPSTRHASTCR